MTPFGQGLERNIVVEAVEVGGGLRGGLRRLLLRWSPLGLLWALGLLTGCLLLALVVRIAALLLILRTPAQ